MKSRIQVWNNEETLPSLVYTAQVKPGWFWRTIGSFGDKQKAASAIAQYKENKAAERIIYID